MSFSLLPGSWPTEQKKKKKLKGHKRRVQGEIVVDSMPNCTRGAQRMHRMGRGFGLTSTLKHTHTNHIYGVGRGSFSHFKVEKREAVKLLACS